jgi:predicted PhzF superfamily epimerase YddE/YHI9
MGRESLLHIEIAHSDGNFTGVSVGGECVYMGEGCLEV